MRVLVYDRTCVTTVGGLSTAWRAGSGLYRVLRRIDASTGVASWGEALAWIAAQPVPITEIQYWGHGRWGRAMVDRETLDASALRHGHALHTGLVELRAKLAPGALMWFRTCETFGATAGQQFAAELADFLGASVAGHTYVIGMHQSGLHGLAPGSKPTWSPDEGLAKGTADDPLEAKGSRPWAPNTITCFHGSVPPGWFS